MVSDSNSIFDYHNQLLLKVLHNVSFKDQQFLVPFQSAVTEVLLQVPRPVNLYNLHLGRGSQRILGNSSVHNRVYMHYLWSVQSTDSLPCLVPHLHAALVDVLVGRGVPLELQVAQLLLCGSRQKLVEGVEASLSFLLVDDPGLKCRI